MAHEVDNSTIEDLSSPLDDEVLSQEDTSQIVLKAASDKINTQIEVESSTDFDVIGSYFKIKLSDEQGKAISNSKVTFTLLSKTYTKTTDSDGIASLQLNIKDGTYNITTKFAGNSNYKASSNTTAVTMTNTRIVDSGLSNSEIQKIIDDAKDKNVILFKAKSYSDINLVINKRLTLISNSNTVLKSGSANPVISIKGKNSSYTIINGFNIQAKGNGIAVIDSDFVRIVNNDISTGANAIVATGTKYLNITKNNINKNTKSGIVIGDSTSTYIFNNNIKNNGANGIEIAKSDKVYIHGNTITVNKKNGIVLSKTANGVNYGEGPKNVQINQNTISKNDKTGIEIDYTGNGISIKSNTISTNKEDGIGIAHIGSNTIQSNVITENWANGIKFFDNYVKPSNQEISYNAIYSNLHMDVEAKDTYYQDTGSRLEIGDNWYSDFAGICPKIRSNNIKFTVSQIGDNKFQVLFQDSNGNIASLLPDRTLTYKTNNGKSVSVTISGGAGVFTVDAHDGDLIKATVDNSRRDNTYDGNSEIIKLIYGVTHSYDYPPILYDDYGGNGGGNGNGHGGSGGSNQGDSSGNGTHTQQSSPTNSANNPINDVSQTATQDASSSLGSQSSSGNVADAGSQSQSQSVAKRIVFDEDEFVKSTGISFIILLIILGIYLYYREDILEMKSKL